MPVILTDLYVLPMKNQQFKNYVGYEMDNYFFYAGEGREARKCLCIGTDGSVPATGKGDVSEDGDVMLFDGDKIARMTEIRNARHTLRQPGWA